MTTPEAKKLFEQTRQELISKQVSNAETYDNALLSLSSAFLGLSIAFVKDIIPLNQAHCTCLLYASWLMFSLTIILVIASFIHGQRSIKKLIKVAENYYLKGDQDAYDESERISKRIDLLNTTSGIVFIVAILLTVTFVIVNSAKVENMSNEKKVTTNVDQKSQPTNSFQKPQSNQQSGTQTSQGQQQTKKQ